MESAKSAETVSIISLYSFRAKFKLRFIPDRNAQADELQPNQEQAK